MSEVVVRMEMPEGCICCPIGSTSDACGYHWCGVLEQDMEECLGRPTDCPILAVLPEKHGRLVDADEDVSNYITVWDCNCSEYGRQTVMAVDDLNYLPTIVPATEGGNHEAD